MERNENGMPIAKNGKPIEDMTRTERRAPMNTDGCSDENGGCAQTERLALCLSRTSTRRVRNSV
jgi:hypothetical protein